MLQQPALPQSTQGMQVSFAPPPQATLPQSQRVRPSPPNQGQHGYMPRQRPSQPPTQLNQPMSFILPLRVLLFFKPLED